MFDNTLRKINKRINKFINKLSPQQRRLLELLNFLIIFNLLAIPLHLILYFKIDFYHLALIERAQVSFFLKLFGVKHTLQDVPLNNDLIPAINLNDRVLAIGEPCTAIRSLIAFIALVFASPRTMHSKKKSLILLPVIYLANIVRIITLAFVSNSYPSLFDFIHIFLWREGLVLLIIGLWFYWFNHYP